MKKNLFFITLSLIVLSGCGYTTRSAVSSSGSSIYVENFVNKIDIAKETSDEAVYYAYRPGMESDITRQIINRFIYDGNYLVTDAKNAHFLLKGQLVEFKREPLRYDANDNVIEYRLSLVTNIELDDNRQGSVVWQER